MTIPSGSKSAGQSFGRLRVRVVREFAELAVAEAWEGGACGLEERDGQEGFAEFIVYFPWARAGPVSERLSRALAAVAAAEVGGPERLSDTDWSRAWRVGFEAVEVSPRLRIRPPFVRPLRRPGLREVVIAPGQAFGTGRHPTTRLALEWIEPALARVGPAARVLDVGCGSGILALAALRLGAGAAVACDLDPAAVREAQANAIRNRLAGRLDAFVGSLAALARVRFELVMANLLRSELEPLLPEIAARTSGAAVLSGLLASEGRRIECALHRHGFRVAGSRQARDASGECWLALLTTPGSDVASSRASGPR